MRRFVPEDRRAFHTPRDRGVRALRRCGPRCGSPDLCSASRKPRKPRKRHGATRRRETWTRSAPLGALRTRRPKALLCGGGRGGSFADSVSSNEEAEDWCVSSQVLFPDGWMIQQAHLSMSAAVRERMEERLRVSDSASPRLKGVYLPRVWHIPCAPPGCVIRCRASLFRQAPLLPLKAE